MASTADDQDGTQGRQDADLAANVARQKINQLYQADEPKAKAELAEIKHEKPTQMSKHQRYMEELSKSGKSLPQIQTAWHEYYIHLPDHEKHEVWQEFYQAHQPAAGQPAPAVLPAGGSLPA